MSWSEMPIDAQEKARQRIAALWERNLPQTRGRLDILQHAAETACGELHDDGLMEEAADTAHKMSGSLGMFGFHEGTKIARELEAALEDRMPEAERLRYLVHCLRKSLQLYRDQKPF